MVSSSPPVFISSLGYHPSLLASEEQREIAHTTCQKVNSAVFLTFAPPAGELGGYVVGPCWVGLHRGSFHKSDPLCIALAHVGHNWSHIWEAEDVSRGGSRKGASRGPLRTICSYGWGERRRQKGTRIYACISEEVFIPYRALAFKAKLHMLSWASAYHYIFYFRCIIWLRSGRSDVLLGTFPRTLIVSEMLTVKTCNLKIYNRIWNKLFMFNSYQCQGFRSLL